MRKRFMMVFLFALLSVSVVHADPMTYTSSPGFPIPDSGVVLDELFVPDSFLVSDLNLQLDISHTWVGDLYIELMSPTGVVIKIMDRPGVPATDFGCSTNDINATFDDEGLSGPVETMCGGGPAIFGTPIPEQALSVFDGMDASGSWLLFVADRAGGDTGVLNSWSLQFNSVPSTVPEPSSLLLLGIGLLGLGGRVRRKQSS